MDFPRIMFRTFRPEDNEDDLTEAVLIESERELMDLAYSEYASRELSAIQRVGGAWTYDCADDDDGKVAFESELDACMTSLISSSTAFDLLTLGEARAFVERRKKLFPVHWGMLRILPLEMELQRLSHGNVAKLAGAVLPEFPTL